MGEYRFRPDIDRVLRRQMLTRALPVMGLAVAVGVGIAVARSGIAGLVLTIPLVVIVIGWSMFNTYRRQRAQAAGFTLTVTAEQVIREVPGVPLLTLHRDEIERIERHPTGEISVRVSDPRRSLRIPAQIDRPEALLAELAALRPIEDAPPPRGSWRGVAAGVLVLAAFAVTSLSQNRLVVIAVGSALAVALIASAVMIVRNRQLERRVRWIALWMLLPLAAVLARVIMAIRGAL